MPVVLYGYPSTASLVVHLKLIELCIEHELQPLDSDRREQKSPQYLALNPAGRMPALVIDGQVLIESVAIATHWPTSTPQARGAGGWYAGPWRLLPLDVLVHMPLMPR